MPIKHQSEREVIDTSPPRTHTHHFLKNSPVCTLVQFRVSGGFKKYEVLLDSSWVLLAQSSVDPRFPNISNLRLKRETWCLPRTQTYKNTLWIAIISIYKLLSCMHNEYKHTLTLLTLQPSKQCWINALCCLIHIRDKPASWECQCQTWLTR